MRNILKVLVGSNAHGLATEDSDVDYRGVFVSPTSDLLRFNAGGYKSVSWVEGAKEDDTSYELAHFLHLSTKSNPSILEVYGAPVIEKDEWGEKLLSLFEHTWSSRGVWDAFGGYSLNQRKKMLDDRYEFRSRKWKYAVAYIRVLIQGIYLLRDGEMIVEVPSQHRKDLISIRNGEWSQGRVIDLSEKFKTAMYEAYEKNPDKQSNRDPLNDFLLSVRKDYWE